MSSRRDNPLPFIFNEFRRLSQAKKIKLATIIYTYDPDYIKETKSGIIVNMKDFSDALLDTIQQFIVLHIYGNENDQTND